MSDHFWEEGHPGWGEEEKPGLWLEGFWWGEVGDGWRRGFFRGERGWTFGACPVRMQDGGQTEDRGWTTED